MAISNPHRHLFSTSTFTTFVIWNLLRSHSPPLETTFSNSIPNPTPSLISSILTSFSSSSSSGDRLLSLRFFVWAGFQSKHRHSSLYSSSFSSSSSFRLHLNPHLLHSLLDSYASQNHPFVSLKTFKILFNLIHYSNHPYPFALSVLCRIPEFGCRPDVHVYNVVLKLPSISPKDVNFVLDEIKGSGLRPDVITYVSVIKKLCEGGRIEEARRLTVRMEEEDGSSLNVVVFSALLDGACSCGDLDAGLRFWSGWRGKRSGIVARMW